MDDRMRSNPFRKIYKSLRFEMIDVTNLISQQINPILKLSKNFTQKDLSSKKKMLRSMLAILGAKAFNYHGNSHLQLAAVSELIHIAFLFHDHHTDQLTRSLEDSKAAVLVGDFLCSRAIEMMVEANNQLATQILSTTINTMSEGLIIKTLHYNDPEITEEIYLEIINRNNVSLISASAQLGAILCCGSEKDIKSMAQYGRHLGFAYQMTKDASNCLYDAAQGKLTLPLINTIKNADKKQAALISELVLNNKQNTPTRKSLKLVAKALKETQSIDYTRAAAKKEILLALDHLNQIPDTDYKNALLSLSHSIDALNLKLTKKSFF